MMNAMVLLVGEQPIPNLLPVLNEKLKNENLNRLLLVHTDRTVVQSQRLHELLSNRCQCDLLSVSAYDIVQIRTDLGKRLADEAWRGPETVFNLTGGTKTMAFAAYELAVRLGSDFLYFQTEGGRSLIYLYQTVGGAPILQGPPEEVPSLLRIDDYLRAHLGNYTVDGFSKGEGGLFERAVHDAVLPVVDEVVPGVRFSSTVEVDLVIRCGNQVGIAEIKSGKPSKERIGQLATAGDRTHLGTYTRRFLIVSRSWDEVENLRELAVARDVTLIELPSFQTTGALSGADTTLLHQRIGAILKCATHKPA
jgi:hypothetical protein